MENNVINRGTGLLVIEVINSNPNGDPDRESDPRQRYDDRGEISAVSFKRKLRDLVHDKEGPVWKDLASRFSPPLDPERFYILETRGRERKAVENEVQDGTFVDKYWDGRVFGNTFLEEGSSTFIRTGVVQFGLGLSVAPIRIERMTTTNMAGVQEGKDRGMAPLGYRIVPHGVYTMPFFVNPSAAHKTGCTKEDIELMLRLIPYAYTHTASYVRSQVVIQHAWYAEHKTPLGSCQDHLLIQTLTPRKADNPDKPSSSLAEYEVPDDVGPLRDRLAGFTDLVGDA